jgi:lysozyme
MTDTLTLPVLAPEALGLLQQFEGKPRLVARLCEGGRYEVAYGVTYYLDGSPVREGDRITEDQVMPLTLSALAKEAAPVWKALQVPVNSRQAGALAVFAFNVGGSAAASSTVVRMTNEGRFEDAAASFGSWTGATSSGPTPSEISAGIVPEFPAWNRETRRWLSPEGAPCSYFRRFRGLLRRHHAEGCLYLGYDWEEAVKNDAISMAVEPRWNNVRARWEDKIVRQTEFSEVLSVARRYPLAGIPIAAEPDPPQPAAPVIEVKVEPLPEILPEPPLPKPVEKPVSAPPPVKATLPDDFDPAAGVKSMIYSRRFWGWVLIILGRFSFVTDAGASWLASTGAVANSVAADPLLLDAYTGFAVMMAGEGVRWWGEKKATRALK